MEYGYIQYYDKHRGFGIVMVPSAGPVAFRNRDVIGTIAEKDIVSLTLKLVGEKNWRVSNMRRLNG